MNLKAEKINKKNRKNFKFWKFSNFFENFSDFQAILFSRLFELSWRSSSQKTFVFIKDSIGEYIITGCAILQAQTARRNHTRPIFQNRNFWKISKEYEPNPSFFLWIVTLEDLNWKTKFDRMFDFFFYYDFSINSWFWKILPSDSKSVQDGVAELPHLRWEYIFIWS